MRLLMEAIPPFETEFLYFFTSLFGSHVAETTFSVPIANCSDVVTGNLGDIPERGIFRG